MPDLKTRNLLVRQVVFVVFMMTSIAGWQFARDTLNSQSLIRCEQDATHLHERIEARFDTYAQVFRGGVGLFNSSENVTRDESLPRYYPALCGIGFRIWVGGEENIQSHEATIRTKGFPAYAMRPAGGR